MPSNRTNLRRDLTRDCSAYGKQGYAISPAQSMNSRQRKRSARRLIWSRSNMAERASEPELEVAPQPHFHETRRPFARYRHAPMRLRPLFLLGLISLAGCATQ